MMKIVVALALLFTAVLAAQVRYDGYAVHRVIPTTEEHVVALRKLSEQTNAYSFWTEVAGVNMPVDIMVPPHMINRFKDFVNLQQLNDEIYIADVQQKIERSQPRGIKAMEWTDYHEIPEIHAWLEELAATYPGVVTLVVGGSSYEGRQILGVKVSFNAANENQGVFLEAGIHAREWISPATVTFILNEILTSTDPAVRQMAESHDWYIFPVTNPDGYAYTFSSDRLWRKTRVPYGFCHGADPNRNWGFHWMDGGSSSDPCSDTYAGPSAFSEIETRSLSEYITSISDKLIAYIGFHSYSQLLLIPYGHSSAHVENYDELYTVGLKAAESLAQRYGTDYTVGNIVEVIYVASGGSMDWVKGTHGTRITYTYELRDTGFHGFLLPPEQIIPTAEETLDSLVTILQEFAATK